MLWVFRVVGTPEWRWLVGNCPTILRVRSGHKPQLRHERHPAVLFRRTRGLTERAAERLASPPVTLTGVPCRHAAAKVAMLAWITLLPGLSQSVQNRASSRVMTTDDTIDRLRSIEARLDDVSRQRVDVSAKLHTVNDGLARVDNILARIEERLFSLQLAILGLMASPSQADQMAALNGNTTSGAAKKYETPERTGRSCRPAVSYT